jgi:hypothetical protein
MAHQLLPRLRLQGSLIGGDGEFKVGFPGSCGKQKTPSSFLEGVKGSKSD